MGKPKSSARARVAQEQVEAWLSDAGWWLSDDGWRNALLNGGKWPWPLTHAAQLQTEADDGRQDCACRMLRGEP